MARKGRVAAIITVMVIAGLTQFGLAFRAEMIRRDGISRVCASVEAVKDIVKDQQRTNLTDPIAVPPGSPPFVEAILKQVNSRGDAGAKRAIKRLEQVDCQ